jgi:signal transduction histidine kinase
MVVLQTAKGWFFIIITTFLIFKLLRREFEKVKKLERLMIQNEKMMSISNLALGMANEINNPLAGIAQNAQLLKNRLLKKQDSNSDIARDIGLDLDKLSLYVEKRDLERIIDSILISSKNASYIIDRVLSFTSHDSNEYKSSKNIKQLLESTLELIMKDKCFQDIRMIKEYKHVPDILCEASKLQHVFFNILTNAFEAMTDAGLPLRIFLRIYKADNFVHIEITDSGPGMSDRIRSKVFEPFFTTKENAKGLGMAIAYHIISDIHEGSITVESKEGKGTTFTIHLPIS